MVSAVKKVFVGSDHAGFALKQSLLPRLRKEFSHIPFDDVGCCSEESTDYPDYAKAVGERVSRGEGMGILICGTGIGQSIAANKVIGVRAAAVSDMTAARLSRQHNDANILCFGSRLIGFEVAMDLCRIWLTTEFEGGRHKLRIDLITKLERGR